MAVSEKIVQVRIPEHLHKSFKDAASRRGVPMSILLREMITEYCAGHSQLDILESTKPPRRKQR